MKPPAFQFYPDDFLAGTFQFTDEECGQYIRCLCHQWSVGALSEDDLHGMTRVGKISEKVRKKFVLGADGQYRNARLEHERKKQKQFRDNKKQAGKAGANKRWQTHASANGKTMAEGMANDSSPSPSPSPTVDHKEKKDAPRPVRPSFSKPSREQLNLQAGKVGLPSQEVDKFVNFYESNGWKVGRNPMRSWVHALTNWKVRWEERRQIERASGKPQPTTFAQAQARQLAEMESRATKAINYDPSRPL